MTRTLYTRDSIFMRLVSAFVALAFTLSLAGTGFAAPQVSSQDSNSSPAVVSGDPAANAGAPDATGDKSEKVVDPAPEPAKAEKPKPEPSVEAAPTTTDPTGTGGAKERTDVTGIAGPQDAAPAVASAGVVAAAVALPYADFGMANWEAWRVSPASQVGWAKSNLGEYKEGDYIPIRIVIDNTARGAVDVRVPSFETAFDYLDGTKNAVGIDDAKDFRFYATSGGSLPGASPYPAGAQDVSGYFSSWVNNANQYLHVAMAQPGTDLVIPAGQYGIIYFQVHIAISQYWQHQNPNHDGAMSYPGSSAQGRFLTWNGTGTGDKTISLPVGPAVAPEGAIHGVKFNDLNHNGTQEAGEVGLGGWTFTINYGGEFPFSASTVSAADGSFSFTGLPAGTYSLDETGQSPWVNSTPLPMSITLARDEVTNVKVGNYVPDVTKTWSLSIDTLPVGGSPFVRYAVNGGASVTTTLTGSGPYTASIQVPVGATISGISWYMLYNAEEVLLGTSPNETLRENKTNSFTYDSSISGRKFDSATESGLAGWTIVLKRVVGQVETEYARTITGAGGAYSFEDVIPGTYKLEEIQQSGWLNTLAPSGTFTIANGTHHTTGADFWNLFIQSSISIDKTGPAMAHVGDSVPYVITVTNTGNYTLTNVIVSDVLLGLNTNIGSLAPQQSQTINVSRTVLAGDTDPLPNTAAVIGTTIFGGQVAADDDHLVDIIKPAVSVVKTADPTMSTNPASVTYTYVVTNTGEDTLFNVALTDDRLTVPGGSIGTLAPQQSVTRTATSTLTQTTTNVATVVGADVLGLQVSDTDDARVQVFNPSISIVKSASSSVVLPGGLVTYTYLVTNTGDVTLSPVTVTDNVLGPIGVIPTLAPQAFATLTFTLPIGADVTNIGTATGYYGTPETDFFGSVVDSDPEFVDVVHPAVEIVKTGAPDPILKGGTVTYTFQVFNRGDVGLYDVLVTDDHLGTIGTVGFIPVDGSATLSTSTVLTATTTNIAQVLAHDEYMHPVSDTDDETIEVFDPQISIVKTVNRDRVVSGDTVTYSYLVTNEGDITLHDIVVTDDVLGAIGIIPSLAPQGSATLTMNATITNDVTNVGTAVGQYGRVESPFSGSVTDSDDAHVDAIHPAVEVIKSVDPDVIVSGTEVLYTFLVHNTGDSTLYDLDVNDDHLGFIGTVAELPADGTATLTKTATLTQTTTNVATVDGYDEFENPVSDTDDAHVDVFNPSISIVKSASANTILAGESVTYTYLVTNTGDTPLFNISVTDDVLGAIGTIPALAPAAFDTVTFTTTISADVTNIGTAVGWYGNVESDFFGSVQASEPESVDVINPAIGVVKTADPTAIVLGESVTYTYVVSNIGDVDLFGVTLTDDHLGVVGTLATLPVEGSQTFTVTTAPSEPTTNVVTAVGFDRLQHQVSATDDAFVDVSLPFTGKPDMAIDKSADKTQVKAGDYVNYTLTYRNVGDDDAFDVTIVDDFDERYVTIVDAGGGTVSGGKITWSFDGPISPEAGADSVTYRVRINTDLPASVTRIDNVVRVTTPGDDNPDNDTDTWRVTLGEPFLPFTGGELTLLALAAMLAALAGVILRRLGRAVS